MFYSSDLLVFKRGRFSLIWLAATRGEGHLSRRDLNTVDISVSCSDLLEYIKLKKTVKLSLYLSSQLTFGICVIYRKKINKLLYDLQELYKKSLPLANTVKHTTDKQKGTKKIISNEVNICHIIDDFPSYNESFGILNDYDNSLVMKDNINYNIAFNQARIEDITFMEYDIVPTTLRNYLENDLEPLNAELMQELLGTCDTQVDLEVLLQKPFNEEYVTTDKHDLTFHVDQINSFGNVDLDQDIGNRGQESLNGNMIIESSFIQSVRDDDKIVNKLNEGNVTLDHAIQVKSSRVIEEVETNNEKNHVEMIDLIYPLKKKGRFLNKFGNFELGEISNQRPRLKRKVTNRSLIVDNVTTISHQVIRENMNKNNFCLVDKNSLFPNALISKSLKSQVACSASNLFEFPGNFQLLQSKPLLSLWMKRKNTCRNCKSGVFQKNMNTLTKHVTIGSAVEIAITNEQPIMHECKNIESKPVIKDATVDVAIPEDQTITNISKVMDEISDVSIERLRGRDSKRTTTQMDSFTFGSDSLQKSIQQISFEEDKIFDDVNRQIFDEPIIHQVDVSMLPIIEEGDIDQRQDDAVNGPVVPANVVMVDKSGVWRMIKNKFNEQLNNNVNEDEVRVSFYEICPKGSSKKNASIFFITLLRLAKYKKIKLFQDKFDSDILLGLPLLDVP